MKMLIGIWRKLTKTKALENSSGELETAFFESTHRVTYLIGLSTANEGLLYQLYSSTVKLLLAFLVCGEVWYTLTVPSTLDETVGIANCIVLQIISGYKYKKMLKVMKDYKEQGMDQMSLGLDITTNKRKKIVEYWANKNNQYLQLLLGLGNLALFAWYLFPLVDDIEYNLIVDIRLPFDYTSPRIYIFTYILVAVVFCYIAHYVMSTDLILQSYLLHLVCQFDILADCIENLFEDSNPGIQLYKQTEFRLNKELQEKYKKRLGVLVEQHRSILKLVLQLRNILSLPMVGQLVASGALICFVGYQAIMTLDESPMKGLMSSFFLGYNIFAFYIVCRWCEEVTTQSLNIGMAAYCCSWESGFALIPTIRSSLMLIIARSNKPLIFTAGGMYNLSLLSYTSLVKTSYSALTVLLRFKQK